MAARQEDTSWMWHPNFAETREDTAGLLVHFRRIVHITQHLPARLTLNITADTRYKLFVNQKLVFYGPVKGDENLWFNDEVDIAPRLQIGKNVIVVTVLRLFYATAYAPSFPRLPFGGLRLAVPEGEMRQDVALGTQFESSPDWETTIDFDTAFRIDEAEDDFLHVYERISRQRTQRLDWVPAQVYNFQASTGLRAPWRLSPRMIPPPRMTRSGFSQLHNIQSTLPSTSWYAVLSVLPESCNGGFNRKESDMDSSPSLALPAHSVHEFDLEMDQHTTAFLTCRFQRPLTGGSTLILTYAESYEGAPVLIPYLRCKGDRRDTSMQLLGPKDIYTFEGVRDQQQKQTLEQDQGDFPRGMNPLDDDEIYTPFHFRTFRFVRVRIEVASSELVLHGFDVNTVTYPLDIHGAFDAPQKPLDNMLWSTSLRTLQNCMHDCYEDCPFYEQLQYAMDTRSSSLFTYCSAADDRLARQAIVQLHASIDPHTGLTASRAPCHSRQTIPHFSLFWVCMLNDHLTFFNDTAFLARFVSAADGVLSYFHRSMSPFLGLVTTDESPGIWNFVDWTDQWRPYGVPPAAVRTGISTYTNLLYAYTLKQAAVVAAAVGRSALADEYLRRASSLVTAIKLHCCTGDLFTDGLGALADPRQDYSQHNQVWAVLCGAATGSHGQRILRHALETHTTPANGTDIHLFTSTSTMMSFYTRRALSVVGGELYNELYDRLWAPWREQLKLNLTTWEEDSVSHRSDCHAWGSVPIYEFMAEVGGVRPAAPGWTMIECQPRLSLYSELQVTVPICVRHELGAVMVSWSPVSEKETKVTIRFHLPLSVVVPVYVKLPNQPTKLEESSGVLTYIVKRHDDGVVADDVIQLSKL